MSGQPDNTQPAREPPPHMASSSQATSNTSTSMTGEQLWQQILSAARQSGSNNLPAPGTKGAPKKFKGDYYEVDKFIEAYERVCRHNKVSTDQDKVENVTQYCSRSVRQFIEGLQSYQDKKWSSLAKDLRIYYDADRYNRRYKIRHLEEFIKKQ